MSNNNATELNTENTSAMVMAAGLGTRMRPLTLTVPKPMVKLNGKPLIDYTLERLSAQNISPIVVNMHYLAAILEDHLKASPFENIVLADERGLLLDTGGGAKANLEVLGPNPFFILNSDSLWLEEDTVDNLAQMCAAWDGNKMDCLMLLADANESLGYSGKGDFNLEADGKLSRRAPKANADHVHTGCCLIHPRCFASAPAGPFSLNLLWNKALEEGRLFGLALNGLWMHIGTPEALQEAEEKLKTKQTI